MAPSPSSRGRRFEWTRDPQVRSPSSILAHETDSLKCSGNHDVVKRPVPLRGFGRDDH